MRGISICIVFLICGVIGDFFGVFEIVSQVYASSEISTISEQEISFASNLQLVIRLIYLLMRPLIAIAGATMDNSLVMGEVFYLNVSIYKMWQIMRNFANFALGGLFLFALLRNVFVAMSGSEDYINGERGVKNLLPKMLLAAVLVQASFFVMSTLIDLSTVAIYSVGTLPVNAVMRDASSGEVLGGLENVRFLKPNVKYSIDNTKAKEGTDATFNIFYSCPGNEAEKYYIACKFINNKTIPLGKEDGTEDNTRYNHKKVQAESRAALTNQQVEGDNSVLSKIDDEYCVYGNSLIGNVGHTVGTGSNTKTIQEREEVNVCKIAFRRGDAENVKSGQGVMAVSGCPTLAGFMSNAAGMTGPLYGLYANILRMDQIGLTTPDKDYLELSLEFLIKIVTAVALFIPLLALAVAMMMRLVALWGFIIFAPLLIVAWIFFKSKIDGAGDGKMSVSSLMGLIFMPVLVVFAISLSLVFLTLLSRSDELNQTGAFKDVSSNVGNQYEPGATCNKETGEIDCPDKEDRPNCGNINDHCYDIAGITSLCFSESQTNFGNTILNIMSYLLINFFGIALMWMVVFAAMKSSKITAGVTDKIQGLGQDLMKLVPIPLAGGLSYNDIQNRKNEVLNAPNRIAGAQNRSFQDYMDRMNARNDEGAKKVASSMDDAVTKNDQAAAKQLYTNGKNGPLAGNTSIYDYGNGVRSLGVASGVEDASSLTDIARNRKGYDTLRDVGGGDLSQVSSKLNKYSGERVRNETTSKINNEIRAGLEDLALTDTKMRDLGNGRFFDTDKKEYISISDDGIMGVLSAGSIANTKKSGIDASLMNEFLETVATGQRSDTSELLSSNRVRGLSDLRTNLQGSVGASYYAIGADGKPNLQSTPDLSTIEEDTLLVEFGDGGTIVNISHGSA